MKNFFSAGFRVNVLLFICSVCIYFFYFGPVLLQLNSVLSSINGDSLKNYYSYMHHIKNDPSFLHFNGQNFPYGEHIIFTDCQPLLTLILRCLPFTHPYLIGILHGLLFLSFMITPLVLNQIFRKQQIDRFSSFFISLAIGLLSPQYFKLLGGHYGLAYTCLIPLCILLLFNVIERKSVQRFSLLAVFNLALFFIHPYMGFGTSLFSLLSLLIMAGLRFTRKEAVANLSGIVYACVLPILLFKLFLIATDTHTNRILEPLNVTTLISNTASFLLPNFGPFQEVLPKVFKLTPSNFEGLAYLGLFLILFSFVSLLIIPFLRKKISPSKETTSTFIASLLLLILAFGLHNDLFELLRIKSAILAQFRASGRFSWFFYYTLPIFLIPLMYHGLMNYFKSRKLIVFRAVAVIFFLLNLLEANSLFEVDQSGFWKFQNFFRKEQLSDAQKKLIQSVNAASVQAILPLPLYHEGSDMYARPEAGTMLPSMILSYHCNLPVMGAFFTRTSMTETREIIQTLNAYKKDHPIATYFNGKDFLLLKINANLFADEDRLLSKATPLVKDSLVDAFLLKEKDLFRRIVDEKQVWLSSDGPTRTDSSQVVYIRTEARKPFLTASMNDYEVICTVDSTTLETGTYILSLHYHYSEETFQAIACNLILNRITDGKGEWIMNTPLKYASGFYDGYAVFEQKIPIVKNSRYEFILKGTSDHTYSVSDFMLRPEKTSVFKISGKDTVINNYAP